MSIRCLCKFEFGKISLWSKAIFSDNTYAMDNTLTDYSFIHLLYRLFHSGSWGSWCPSPAVYGRDCLNRSPIHQMATQTLHTPNQGNLERPIILHEERTPRPGVEPWTFLLQGNIAHGSKG
ncbi:hypothetical protein ILYODFUR_001814 [Ilyodon furcidens]|uniref:Uncharacterized protein n=1 Tax=Ilyodon furcidens TaxID=33524 RepID=A0ABV0UFK6_9TELE